MAEQTQRKTVTLSAKFPAASRVRAGYTFVRGESQTLELTSDQLEAFKNDPYFTVSKRAAEEGSEGGNAGEGGEALAPDDIRNTEANAGTTGETPTTTTVGQTEAPASGPTELDPTAGVGDGPVPEDELTPEEQQRREQKLEEADVPTTPENDNGQQSPPQADGQQEGDLSVDDLLKNNNRDALIQQANEAGVEGLDYDNAQETTKKVIAEAIVAKRQG